MGTWFGRRADRPVVAAGLVGATAVVFSALWSVAFLALFWTEPWVPLDLLRQQIVTAIVAGNAVLVAGGTWRVAVARSESPLTARRGTLVGACIGALSYLTLDVLFAAVFLAERGTFPGAGHAVRVALGYTCYEL